MVHQSLEDGCDPFESPTTSNIYYISILSEEDLSVQRFIPKTAVVGVDGVENGRFYAVNGDDNFIVTEAQADDRRLINIYDGMGDQWNLSALTYSLFVGDCDGHSTGGCHGAVKEIHVWWIFDSGTLCIGFHDQPVGPS